jgi:hypothetical protein
VAEEPVPTTWKEAFPYVTWGILVFSFGLEGVITLVHGEFAISGVSFAGMLAVTAAALHWNQLKRWAFTLDARWVVLLLFVALIALPASSLFENRGTIYAGLIVLAIVAIIAAVVIFFSHITSISRERAARRSALMPYGDIDVVYPAKITTSPPWLPKLYIGNIDCNLRRIKAEHYFDMDVRLFNGNVDGVRIVGVDGTLKFKQSGGAPGGGNFPLRQFSSQSTSIKGAQNVVIAPFTEETITLFQHVSDQVATQLQEGMARSHPLLTFDFMFDELHLNVCSNQEPNAIYRLPLGDGITVGRRELGTLRIINPVSYRS